MRVSSTTYLSRVDVESTVELAVVQLRAPGAETPVCAPPDSAELPAAVGVPPAARSDTGAAAGESDAPAATGMIPTGGGWR